MGRELKKRMLFGVLVLVTVWPAIHHVAVERWEVNPWMFFGLSMYTRPRPIVKVVDLQIGMGRQPLRTVEGTMLGADPQRKADEISYLTGKLALDRLAYGTLRSPVGTVGEIFTLFPRAKRMHIQVEIGEMNAAATMSTRLIDYDCTRRAGAVECSTRTAGAQPAGLTQHAGLTEDR